MLNLTVLLLGFSKKKKKEKKRERWDLQCPKSEA